MARLVPVAREESWQGLIDAGAVIPAEDLGLDLAQLEPMPALDRGPALSELLLRMRDEGRS